MLLYKKKKKKTLQVWFDMLDPYKSMFYRQCVFSHETFSIPWIKINYLMVYMYINIYMDIYNIKINVEINFTMNNPTHF